MVSAIDVYNIVGLVREGKSVREIQKEVRAAKGTIAGYRDVLFVNEGAPQCGCGKDVLHLGRCMWRREQQRKASLVPIKIKAIDRTFITRRKKEPEDRKVVDRCESEVLRAIHQYTGCSVYYIPIQ